VSELTQTKKYSQACQVRAIVEKSIGLLEKNVQEGKMTATRQRRIAAAYMSHASNWSENMSLMHREA